MSFLLVPGLWVLLAASDAWPQSRKSIAPADASNPLSELIPGEEFIAPGTRALQDDNFDNPAFVAVELGERLWAQSGPSPAQSCQSCHGDPRKNGLRRVAANYPKYDADAGRVINLGERIGLCRVKKAQASPWAPASVELRAVTTYLSQLSRGSASGVETGGNAGPVFAKGKQLFEAKLGLLQLSCVQCHNDNYGQKFGGEIISQGHPQSYPVFKVSEGRMSTLHDRFRACNKLVRAEAQAENSQDYIALETYLNWRSKNLPSSAPGVRQ